MEFYEELKAARIKAGLTQQQIADEIGITKSTYCGYETAKRNPDPQRIKQLAKVLHISADHRSLPTAHHEEVCECLSSHRVRIHTVLFFLIQTLIRQHSTFGAYLVHFAFTV